MAKRAVRATAPPYRCVALVAEVELLNEEELLLPAGLFRAEYPVALFHSCLASCSQVTGASMPMEKGEAVEGEEQGEGAREAKTKHDMRTLWSLLLMSFSVMAVSSNLALR